MPNTSAQIETIARRAAQHDPEGLRYAGELARLGAEAIPAALAILRDDPSALDGYLIDGIAAMRDDGAITALVNAAADKDTLVAMAAVRALGRMRSASATDALLEIVLASSGREGRRATAAEAIMQSLAESQLRRLEEIRREAQTAKLETLEAAVLLALGKQHRNSVCSRAIELLETNSDPAVRSRAVRVLWFTTCPGMLPALKRSLEDSDADVRLKTVDALFYLGTPDAIAVLVSATEDSIHDVAAGAALRLDDITHPHRRGLTGVNSWTRWWSESTGNFNPLTCYRFGAPIELGDVIALLGSATNADTLLAELYVRTGNRFDLPRFDEHGDPRNIAALAQDWWTRSRHRFPPGGLYKLGDRHDPSRLG
jgi:HEAT repeat protein